MAQGAAVPLDALERWVRGFAAAVHAEREHLTALDAAIGDADHGANLDRGMTAVVAKLDGSPPESAGALLRTTGMTLVSTVGGASGPLYGTLFLRMGTALGDTAEVDGPALVAGWRAALEGVVARGKAQPGDATMVDALAPAVDALAAAVAGGAGPAEAMAAAAAAGASGRDATEPMQARKGRASYLGERSIGHVDPGATSTVLLLDAAAEALR